MVPTQFLRAGLLLAEFLFPVVPKKATVGFGLFASANLEMMSGRLLK